MFFCNNVDICMITHLRSLIMNRIKAFVIGASGKQGIVGKPQKNKKSLEEAPNPTSAKLVIDLQPGMEWFEELLSIALTASKGFSFRV